ncbi:MAG: hypothetical protein ACTSRS_16805 [Candidatus Helarchaeota archaeon]
MRRIGGKNMSIKEDKNHTRFATDIFVNGQIAGRIARWIANCLEQYANNRLVRLRAKYIGPIT